MTSAHAHFGVKGLKAQVLAKMPWRRGFSGEKIFPIQRCSRYNQERSVTLGGSPEDNCDSSEDELTENSFQRPPMWRDSLFSARNVRQSFRRPAHLLICRILKTLAKNKPIDGKHKVQGILHDKLCGVVQHVHCANVCEMQSSTSSKTLYIKQVSS